MFIVNLTPHESLDFFKSAFRQSGFDFLLISIARFPDNDRFFIELESDWRSIHDVTGDKIAFLHFSEYTENHSNTIITSPYEISASYFTTLNEINIPSLFEKRGKVKYDESKDEHYMYFDGKMQLFPKLSDSLKNTIETPVSLLLKHLNKTEQDVPFLYLCQLSTNKVFFVSFDDVFANGKTVYRFIRDLVIKIDNEPILKRKIVKGKSNIKSIQQYRIQPILEEQEKLKKTIERKKRQSMSMPEELQKDVDDIINFIGFKLDTLDEKMRDYISAILNKERYSINDDFKNDNNIQLPNGQYINNVIKKYANKDLKNIEGFLISEITRYQIMLDEKKREDSNKIILLEKEIVSIKQEILNDESELENLFKSYTLNKSKKQFNSISDFKIALTFAGENRNFVERVANILKFELDIENIFYDKYFEAELARLDLDLYLQDIYHNHSQFVVVFLSKDYESKEWCGIEWRAIRDIIKRKERDKVILVKLENFDLGGIFSIDGFLDGVKNSPEQIAQLIARRICT
jgi:TIR domain